MTTPFQKDKARMPFSLRQQFKKILISFQCIHLEPEECNRKIKTKNYYVWKIDAYNTESTCLIYCLPVVSI